MTIATLDGWVYIDRNLSIQYEAVYGLWQNNDCIQYCGGLIDGSICD